MLGIYAVWAGDLAVSNLVRSFHLKITKSGKVVTRESVAMCDREDVGEGYGTSGGGSSDGRTEFFQTISTVVGKHKT